MKRPVLRVGAPLIVALVICASLFRTLAGDTTASVATSQKLYSVGAIMTLNGSGFTPNTQIGITIVRPDQLTDYVTSIFTDGNGAFTATYQPPLEPGRYKFTATDGVNSAKTAATDADAVKISGEAYNKGAIAYNDTTGNWTSGNAGKEFAENQWVSYQYLLAGVSSPSDVPDFDITWNFHESNTNAIFIDALANFRICIDCDLNDSSVVHTSGPNQGLLLDTHPYPLGTDTNWVVPSPIGGLTLDSTRVLSAINSPFPNGATVCPGGRDVQSAPQDFHCLHVSGSALGAQFFAQLNAARAGGHFVTIFYQAHAAASFVWQAGHEYLLGCPTDPAWVFNPGTANNDQTHDVQPPDVVYGTDAFQPNADPCSTNQIIDPITGPELWNTPGIYFGLGSANGSSRDFKLTDQIGDTGSGAVTLPIPSVQPATGSITIVKHTVGADGTFNFTTTGGAPLSNFSLTTVSNTAQKVFSDVPVGPTYTVSEDQSTLPTGFTFTSLACVSTGNMSSIAISGSIATLIPATGENITCTYTNTGVISSTTLTLKSSTPTDGSSVAVGTPVTIVVTETNTGNGTITGVSVTAGGACTASGFTGGATTLAAGASTDFRCTFTTVAGANAWTGDGNGTDVVGKPVPTTGEHVAGSLTGLATSTSLTLKSSTPADGSNAAVGGTATIVVTETNTGTASLSGVNVTGGTKCATFTGGATILAAGASTDFTCTFTITAGANAWFGDGHGTDQFGVTAPSGGEHVAGSLTGLATSTSLTLKSSTPANGSTVQAGTTATIVVTETNTGTTSLSGVNVTGGGKCATFTGGATILAAGASTDFTCTFAVGAGANAWIADGIGTDQFGTPAPSTGEHQAGSLTGVLSTLVLVKNTVGGNGTFNFTGSGAGVVPTTINTSVSKMAVFANILSGPKSLTETVPAGWVGNTTQVSCAETVAGITASDVTGTYTSGTVAAPGTVTASFNNLGVGATVTCTFTNSALPTLTVVKALRGADTTFFFNLNQGATAGTSSNFPTSSGITTVNGAGNSGPQAVIDTINPWTVTEVNLASPYILTDISCTGATRIAPTYGPVNLPISATFGANYGDHVVCTFVNSSGLSTRTQGFWATHTYLSNAIWNGSPLPPAASTIPNLPVINPNDPSPSGSPDSYLCGVQISAIPTAGDDWLIGGFWANIQTTTTGVKRVAIDHDRIQLLQQYLAAVLNFHAFGAVPKNAYGASTTKTTGLASYRADYCGTNDTAIQHDVGILDTFNNSGDSSLFTPGASGTPQTSKTQADLDVWDTPLAPGANDDLEPKTSLTLTKVVNNSLGTAVITDFTLTATCSAGAPCLTAGPKGTPLTLSGKGGFYAVLPEGTYTLSDVGNDAAGQGYTPGSWACTGGNIGPTVNGKATLPLDAGAQVSCSITNSK